ncbi:FHA domain-containing protein [Microbacterium sp. cf332]|uniref:FHA domain-containing protein n=1 Tax=Microbacterium sp. cf332 TaxID=1761804 RepID=UPI0015A3CBC8|nr:FHA domain-containing protein [Microbacterium sp. cf332]
MNADTLDDLAPPNVPALAPPGWRLRVHLGPDRHALAAPLVVVGRAPEHAPGRERILLHSPFREASRSHALVDVDSRGTIVVTDLYSRNGTIVDGVRLAPGVVTAIDPGLPVLFGDVTVRLTSERS